MGRGQAEVLTATDRMLRSDDSFSEVFGAGRGSKRPWDLLLSRRPIEETEDEEEFLRNQILRGRPETVLHLLWQEGLQHDEQRAALPALYRLLDYLITRNVQRTIERWKEDTAFAAALAQVSYDGASPLNRNGAAPLNRAAERGRDELRSSLQHRMAARVEKELPGTQEELDQLADEAMPRAIAHSLAFLAYENGREVVNRLFGKRLQDPDNGYAFWNNDSDDEPTSITASVICDTLEQADWERIFKRYCDEIWRQGQGAKGARAISLMERLREWIAEQYSTALKRSS